jgi:hypothetical protein
MSRSEPDPVSSSAVADPIARVARWARARRLAALLAAIGLKMGAAVAGAASRKLKGDPAMAGVDVGGAWKLLERGFLWARALRVRFDAEVKAARAACDTDPPERLLERENLLPRTASRPRRKSTRGVIAGIPTAAVIAQIRADLVAAATLIRDDTMAHKVAAIGDMLRALTEEAETAPPSAEPAPSQARARARAQAPATRAGPAPAAFDFRTCGTPDTVPPDAAIRWKPPDSG